MFTRTIRLLIGSALLAPFAPLAWANDYYVDAAGGSDAAAGTSRGEAWRTLTHAVAVVPFGNHVIHVGPGVYDTAHGESYPLYPRNGVSIVSDCGSDLTFLEGGISISALLQGFDLTGGPFGVMVSNGTLRDLTIVGSAGNGVFTRTTVVVEHCRIEGHAGAGLFLDDFGSDQNPSAAIATVRDSIIANNGANGVHLLGAGNTYMELDLVGAEVRGNGGFGVFVEGWNLSTALHPYFRVGLSGTLVAANTTGGIAMRPAFVRFQELSIDRSTIAGNGGPGVSTWALLGPPPITNSILWGNVDDLNPSTYAPLLAYCDMEDGDQVGQNGNISAAPRFVDAQGGDYHLTASSPAVDRADPGRGDGGTDRDGDPLKLDGDLDGVTRIDMGYDEFNHVVLGAPVSAGLGDRVTLTVTAPGFWTTFVASSGATGQVPLGSYGSLLLDPSSLTFLMYGIGGGTVGFDLPRDPSLAGRDAYFQALCFIPILAVGSFSNRAAMGVTFCALGYGRVR